VTNTSQNRAILQITKTDIIVKRENGRRCNQLANTKNSFNGFVYRQ
jgi:hypothetical protein